MEDYEIRDVFRRATTPELLVDLSFNSGLTAEVEFADQSELSKPIALIVTVRNRSSQPAHYAYIQIGIDTDLPLCTWHGFFNMKATDGKNWLAHSFMSPPALPMFKELDQKAAYRQALTFVCQASRMGRETTFDITTLVQTTGYSATENWVTICRGNILRLRRQQPA
jgi:hypothetical protein